MPAATEEQCRRFNELQRVSAAPEMAARLVEAAGQIEVLVRLADVKAPTLVAHARDDGRVPFEQGRQLAAGIPGARLVTLDSCNHVLLNRIQRGNSSARCFATLSPDRQRLPRYPCTS
jgi:pimeloyl-ACP methyl ester carboxylesterase